MRHSSTESGGRGRPKPICRTRFFSPYPSNWEGAQLHSLHVRPHVSPLTNDDHNNGCNQVVPIGDPGHINLPNGKPRKRAHWGCLGSCHAPGDLQIVGRMTICDEACDADGLCCQHACLCGDGGAHPESPGRLERVLARLAETGLLAR